MEVEHAAQDFISLVSKGAIFHVHDYGRKCYKKKSELNNRVMFGHFFLAMSHPESGGLR